MVACKKFVAGSCNSYYRRETFGLPYTLAFRTKGFWTLMCRGDLWSPLPSRNKICSINLFLGAPAPRPRLNFARPKLRKRAPLWRRGGFGTGLWSVPLSLLAVKIQLTASAGDSLVQTDIFHCTWLGANFWDPHRADPAFEECPFAYFWTSKVGRGPP